MQRYKEIIPRFKDFKETIKTPQPYDIRVNTLKSDYVEVKNLLEKRGFNPNVRTWNDNFITVEKNPSKTLEHWLGKYYIQEFVSGIPPMVLSPGSDDRVLDLCAAPGSKTGQLAAMMNNRGEILANDRRAGRTRSLLSNLYRLGVVNVQVTERDGRNLPESPKFDKILVDVPCSSEGNARKVEELRGGAEMKKIRDLSGLQKQLLEKSFRMCKNGGTIVYSTCTFAPEENELVVSEFLEEGSLVDLSFDFPHSRGIREWQGEKLRNELRKCVRIYPHQLNSGGLFLAKFKK